MQKAALTARHNLEQAHSQAKEGSSSLECGSPWVPACEVSIPLVPLVPLAGLPEWKGM